MNMPDVLASARTAGTLRDIDIHLVRHLLALDPAATAELALAIAAVSRATADGDVCIDLNALAGSRLFASEDGRYAGIAAPLPDAWQRALRHSVLVGDGSGTVTPLVLDARQRLYLQKYYFFERAIVADIRQRSALACTFDDTALQSALTRFFPGRGNDDQQRQAAAMAAQRPFAVITGGPGTGKTTTVTRLLAVLLALAPANTLRIALAAPTGKAAARLGESLRSAIKSLREEGASEEYLAQIPLEAATLHRLLGYRPGNGFRHDEHNPLPANVLVVDEASMIDQALMSRLLKAVPGDARLILLGDHEQLASVEAGSVLGDLCNRGQPVAGHPLAGHIALLTQVHRTRDGGGIRALANAINAGEKERALKICGEYDNLRHLPVTADTLPSAIAAEVEQHLRDYRRQADPQMAAQYFNGFRFLCALRDGPFGVHAVNEQVERTLERAGLIDRRQQHYEGRPLLITENDYGINLFNGDIGLVLRDAGGELRAFFLQGDGSTRTVALNRLPAHETCFAMTVHKSQGSEFARVVLVLPDSDSPLLTRELVYTAVTRASRSVAVFGSAALLGAAIERRVSRASGLRDALWGN